MNNIIFIIFRRMRLPLLTLIMAYAIAILGLSLIPGRDDQGNLWYMDLFHAFYFVSYMSTTIGFGEIPFEFTDAQRLWVTLSIYLTVISWLYAIGTIFTLIQDKGFQEAIREARFAHKVRQLREPFYLICGYGETGAELVRVLTEQGKRMVVIDSDDDRLNILKMEGLRQFVPALHADAQLPIHLQEAGLKHNMCAAVLALTNRDDVNLNIAITSKLLHPHIKVICRADTHDFEANMASFGTDHIMYPFDVFATQLATALDAPCLYLLQQWLAAHDNQCLSEPIYPPRDGHWIICGFGRMGKSLYARLKEKGIKAVVVESNIEMVEGLGDNFIQGRGTEADTLLEAGIRRAVGLVAGTDNDANNLSIIMTGRELNEGIFVIARQNLMANKQLFDAVDAEMVMHPSTMIADKVRVLLATPLLSDFLRLIRYQEDEWACELVSRISALVEDRVPGIHEKRVTAKEMPAVFEAIQSGMQVTLEMILRDSWKRNKKLRCIILLVTRDQEKIPLPAEDLELRPDDRLLICAHPASYSRLQWTFDSKLSLDYVLTGESHPTGWLWKKIDLIRNLKNNK